MDPAPIALVTHPDASSVVLDLEQLQSAVFHRHLDVGGLGVQTGRHNKSEPLHRHGAFQVKGCESDVTRGP